MYLNINIFNEGYNGGNKMLVLKSNKVILPIDDPMSSTYMVPASEFALLQTTENGNNYIYNRYIQIYSFGDILNHKSCDVGLSILTDPFDQNPCFISTKIDSKHDYLIEDQKKAVMDCLHRGTYFYSYRYLDELYMSETRYFKKCHMLHMFLIYGYDLNQEVFYTLGYNNQGIFSKIKIHFCEYDDSINNLDETEQRYVILINNNDEYIEKECDVETIKFWLDQYIKSKNSRIIRRGVNDEVAITDNLVFGYRVFDYLLCYLSYFVNNEVEIYDFDFRFLRQLLEHKELMMNRLRMMHEHNLIGKEMLGQYKNIVDIAQMLQYLNIKLLITDERRIFLKIYDGINDIYSKEGSILEKVFMQL